ncbi:DUF3307 domain-containing protein [Methylobacterium sp. E-016]|uniref:DUF3307 domain-containing protein n=1 Tax=Methylobacterium sp. E-016 TaxID=2836556 RepID=UPI001FB99005|nr:DUF3307 domain-containing protein [Methylobacterium sp. E-016]MCJ2077096.1 DUF3307 domain-containing protein [Methylobacterium sp. E-016]
MPPLLTPVPVGTFVLLMLAMELKHYAADFVLQTNWMARGKDCIGGWHKPLAAHAGLHGLATLGLALLVAPALWWLGLVDFVVHGSIDRAKALASQHLQLPVTDARFWWLMGFDQLLHQITNVFLVAMLALA